MGDIASKSTRSIPAPHVNPETEAFWAAASEGKFLVRRCSTCGRTHWYPRAICPFCASEDTEWRPASGFGTVYSFSPVRQASEPYVIAYVRLDEGATMLTNIVGCTPDEVQIGQRVSVLFHPSVDGPPVPVFQPSDGGHS